jgi:hypothetical protein
MKKVLQKISSGISKAWNFLEGKKRRIATVSGLVMLVAKPHTLVYTIAEYSVMLFGGADLAGAAKNKIKLPAGLRKEATPRQEGVK